MKIEWAVVCRDVQQIRGHWAADEIGLTGLMVTGEIPKHVTLPLFMCFVGEPTDQEGEPCPFAYRVIAPDGSILDGGVSGIEREIGTAPQLVSIERYYMPFWIDFHVNQNGEHVIEIGTGAGDPIRLPLWFSVMPDPGP